MKLTDLEPQFLKLIDERTYQHVDSIGEADGVSFICPECYRAKGGPIGAHQILCWTPKVPVDLDPKPGRWNLVGTGYSDLSLVAGSSSVLLTGGCNAHFFVKGGEILPA